jgi:hypothetical protein
LKGNDFSTEHQQNQYDAQRDFERQLLKSFFSNLFKRVKHQPASLLSLSDIRKRFRLEKEFYKGIQSVDISKIVGSEGRYSEFDQYFLPKSGKTRAKWIGIDAAVRSNVSLPPVQLYKVDDIYFVRDGNHRISVAKALGQEFIEAEVTEIETPVKISKNTDIKQILIKQEYTNFLEVTGLKEHLGKDDEIELTELGGYDIILEHIHLHQFFMERDLKNKIPYHAAALSWFREIYQPVIKLVYIYVMTAAFSNRKPGDIYIWMMTNKKFILKEFGSDPDIRTLVRGFTRKYSKAKKEDIEDLIRRIKENS